MDLEDQDELTVEVEASEGESEIVLIVCSPAGKKITQHEFIMAVEMWLHEVTQAEIFRTQSGALNH